ncbi:MAG: GGDEF domain-containing protein [Tardiphaga sp.]|uniref:GGDEF domain-containing protein n=1 Tax=Tardiphaga sp. TaxID=1926292 RepID=UPI0019850DBD|nr:sensor domain-containing diguanylate cyclase [Tardiphaga sp.]MBC7585983.1 GGDEF domain-containing protein [Tardiphaga sp.]
MPARPVPEPIRRISPRWLLAGALLAVIGFMAICGSVLLGMRTGDERLAQQMLGNVAARIDGDISHNVELLDLSLSAVAANMTAPQVLNATPSIRQAILFDHTTPPRQFGAIQVLDEAGIVTIDSAAQPATARSFADAEFFKVHRRDPLAGLYISRPMLHDGTYGLVLSRRIATRDGRFIGVVAGMVRYSYFDELVAGLHLQPDDVVSVVRQDGLQIMRAPLDMAVIGTDVSRLPVVQQALAALSGSHVATSAVDGIERLYVWRDARNPLIVIVGRSTRAIFADWRREALVIAGAMGALFLLVLAVLLLLMREMKKRAGIEDEMARLAITDALTGLGNRRHFDATLAREWRRALRANAPLALLMIDADHFKAFNDAFGHQAGDVALVEIAGCIAGHAQRASDCAARYGGEEFALLLPGLSQSQAIELGERIRSQVEELNTGAAVTVSIGVASLRPAAGQRPADLVGHADLALYSAKAQGRNCTYPVTIASQSARRPTQSAVIEAGS